MKTTPISPRQREFQVNDPVLQPAYRMAQRNAIADGRNFLLHRDFYHVDSSEVVFVDMKRARRHFRLARGLSEGPEPAVMQEFVSKLRSRGLLVTRTSRFMGKKSSGMRIPKRYRKI